MILEFPDVSSPKKQYVDPLEIVPKLENAFEVKTCVSGKYDKTYFSKLIRMLF